MSESQTVLIFILNFANVRWFVGKKTLPRSKYTSQNSKALSRIQTYARLTYMSFFERFSVTVSTIYCFYPKLRLFSVQN